MRLAVAVVVVGWLLVFGAIALHTDWSETSAPATPTYVVQNNEVQTPVGMCRTEDSCSVDFHGGQYTIRQVTP
jgi:hypothetical protein